MCKGFTVCLSSASALITAACGTAPDRLALADQALLRPDPAVSSGPVTLRDGRQAYAEVGLKQMDAIVALCRSYNRWPLGQSVDTLSKRFIVHMFMESKALDGPHVKAACENAGFQLPIDAR